MFSCIQLYCKRPVASLLIEFYTDDLESDHANPLMLNRFNFKRGVKFARVCSPSSGMYYVALSKLRSGALLVSFYHLH